MIKVNFVSLNDRFLTFKLDSIKDSFEDDAWTLVLDIYNKKIDHSTCYICNKLWTHIFFRSKLLFFFTVKK